MVIHTPEVQMHGTDIVWPFVLACVNTPMDYKLGYNLFQTNFMSLLCLNMVSL